MSNLAKANLTEVVNPDTGEISYGYETTKIIKVKRRQFTKLYMQNIFDFKKITKSCDHLLLRWFEYSVNYGSNDIISNSLVRKTMCDYAGIHITDISKALKRLQSAGFIKFNRNLIMLNPEHAYKGDEKDLDKAIFNYTNFK